MTLFISSTLNGITLGAMLFVLASGFTLIYGLMRILNLAHGGIFLWGGYLTVTLTAFTGNYLLGLIAAAIVIALGGLGGSACSSVGSRATSWGRSCSPSRSP